MPAERNGETGHEARLVGTNLDVRASVMDCASPLALSGARMGSDMLNNIIANFLEAWKQPRWRFALIAAAASDALGFGLVLWPPVQWGVDALTAVLLFGLLGFRWPLLPALVVEIVPGIQVFPAWTLVVAALAGAEKRKPSQATDSTPKGAQRIQEAEPTSNE